MKENKRVLALQKRIQQFTELRSRALRGGCKGGPADRMASGGYRCPGSNKRT